MSLAMFAAPFDDNIEGFTSNSDNNIMNKKRRAHTRTQKMYAKESFDTNKVNSVLEKIHNNLDNDDDDDDDKQVFNPPPKPESVGVEKSKSLNKGEESMTAMGTMNEPMFRTLGRAPQPNYEGSDDLDLNDYSNYGDNKTNEEYYKRVIPGYSGQVNVVNKPQPTNKSYYNNANYNNANYNLSETVSSGSSQDLLLQKLNYMITLLEDQQDERTNNVTEEVVLYSFLGIFIIFIADTFVRAGKYVR
jgi:hypothetical protein